jgi:hypothetical protein
MTKRVFIKDRSDVANHLELVRDWRSRQALLRNDENSFAETASRRDKAIQLDRHGATRASR